MFELMAVISGVVLGVLQIRLALSRGTVLGLTIVAAFFATVLSGEWNTEPYLIVVDALLVGLGIAAARIAHRSWLTRRRRQHRLTDFSG